MAQLRQAKVDAASQVKQLQKRCKDVEAAAHLPIPEIKQGNAGARLPEVADIAERMQVALGRAVGTRTPSSGMMLMVCCGCFSRSLPRWRTGSCPLCLRELARYH